MNSYSLIIFLFTFCSAQELVGYYSWSWGMGSIGPAIYPKQGIAFTGYVDIPKAISEYNRIDCCIPLFGDNGSWMTIGGGNENGMFNETTISKVIRDIPLVKQANYSGLVFDIEYVKGTSSDMIPLFKKAFDRAKSYGLMTVVTTSHSAPYSTDTP